ncbi:MAG: hypothetical protein AAGA35_04425 [Patescibacteria group bacterium]
MKKVGDIAIRFKEYKDGIYYSDVQVDILGQQKNICLPRYHQFLGWIEIFGLPPQQEWVVLDTLPNFSKAAELFIDGEKFTETMEYEHQLEKKQHHITLTRTNGSTQEEATWIQNYQEAPDNIQSTVTFEGADGNYITSWTTNVISDETTLTNTETNFLNRFSSNSRKPDVLIRKDFTAEGVVPDLYYQLFPIDNMLSLEQIDGSIFEVGFLQKDSKHKIDTLHGDWFKLFSAHGKTFEIHEHGYSSKEIEVEGERKIVKDTYRKELFEVE